MLNIKHLSSSGDTIVEVLIVLTVLGLALGISFATANTSLLNTRQAQENSEATEIAQSQIESLRELVSNGNIVPATWSPSTIFCAYTDNSNPSNPIVKIDTGFTQNEPSSSDPSYSGYPSNCKVNTLYHVSVQMNPGSTNTFQVVVVWDDVFGQGQDTVTLNYRIH